MSDAMIGVNMSKPAKLVTVLNCAIGDNYLPLGTAAVIIALMAVAGWWMEIDLQFGLYSLPMLFLTPSFVMLIVLGLMVWVLWRARPSRPTSFIASKFMRDWHGLERGASGIPIVLAFSVFFSVFASFKSFLGHVVPFYFDPYARYMDQVLHGEDAWRFYASITAYPFVTAVLSVFYNLWFFAAFALLAFASFLVSDTRLRSQFLTAFLLCWFVIGVVLATALSSAGPCYYQHFYGDGSYQYITQYLQSVSLRYPVPALEVQKFVLDSYLESKPGSGEGISAMPSMHVSVAVLTALFLSRYGRSGAVLGWSYATAILLASIHLGWHYAIDGYVAMALTVIIWKAAGLLVTAGEDLKSLILLRSPDRERRLSGALVPGD